MSLGSHWDPVPHSQEDLLQPGASSSKAEFSLSWSPPSPSGSSRRLKVPQRLPFLCPPQIRNVGTGLCTDTKHGTLGSPLRLETCIRGRGEAGWNSMQVRDAQRDSEVLTLSEQKPLSTRG